MNMTHTNTIHINITHTTTLSRKEQRNIHRITALCHLANGLSLSCPRDGDKYWILEEDTAAAALLAVYKIEVTMQECYAFTHPDFRRKGYFSLLLEQVCRYNEALGEPELCSVTDNKRPMAMIVLRELEVELWSEEHMVKYNVPAAGTAHESGASVSQASLPDTEPNTEPDTELDMNIHMTPEGLLICARVPGSNSPVDGNGATSPDTNSGTDGVPGACVSCRLSLNGTSAYLHSLETVPALRCRGLAGRFLAQLIQRLERKGIRRICLQAPGSNESTLRLCRKTGLRIMETLSYYPY